MAEVVGLVSGGIGIASSTIQIVDSAAKLKKLWSSVKNAPNDVAMLIDHVAVAGRVLSETSAVHTRASAFFTAPSSCESSQLLCESALKELDGLTKRLEKDLQRPRFGALRVALRKDTIKESKAALQGAISILLWAQQTYMQSILVDSGTRGLDQSSQMTDQSLSTPTTPNAMASPHGNIHTSSSAQSGVGRRGARWRTPTGWLGKIWTIEMSRARNGWNFFMRTYRVLPMDHPAFTYAERGDVAGLQSLFQTNEVSPFDRDSKHGFTLLHVAISYLQVEAVQFLLDQGADHNAWDWAPCGPHGGDGASVSSCFWMFVWGSRAATTAKLRPPSESLVKDEAILQSLIVDRQCDEMPDPDSTIRDRAVLRSPAALFLMKSQVFPPHDDQDVTLRVLAARQNDDSRNFWLSLGQDQVDTTCFDALVDSGNIGSLISSIATGLYLTINNPLYEGWTSVLQQAVNMEAHTRVFEQGSSPAYHFLNGYLIFERYSLHDVDQQVTHALKVWTRELQRAGVNLSEYGQQEYEVLISKISRRYWDFRYFDPNLGHHCYFKVVGLTYGPEPEDWRVWLSCPLDEWAGEILVHG